MKKKMKRTDIYLTQRQHKEIKKEADKEGITFSELFRKIVDNYLDREKNVKEINL